MLAGGRRRRRHGGRAAGDRRRIRWPACGCSTGSGSRPRWPSATAWARSPRCTGRAPSTPASALRLAAGARPGHGRTRGGAAGAMASLGADPATVEALLGPGAVIAGLQLPPAHGDLRRPRTPSRPPAERARAAGIAATRLRVSHAFHSPHMEAAGAAPRRRAGGDRPSGRSRRPVVSTVTGVAARRRDATCRPCCAISSPPRSASPRRSPRRDRVDLWIEVGPGRALSSWSARCSPRRRSPLDVGGPSIAGLLAAAGRGLRAGGAGRHRRPVRRPVHPAVRPRPPAEVPGQPLRDGAADGRVAGEPVRPAPEYGRAESGGRAAASFPPPSLARSPRRGRSCASWSPSARSCPLDSVQDDSRLLSDLHLNSISVGQLVVEAARRLGLRPPSSPTDYARATVAEVAEALSQQAPLLPGAASEPAAPAGVDSWVRPFTVELVERPLPRRRQQAAGEGSWRVVAPPASSARRAARRGARQSAAGERRRPLPPRRRWTSGTSGSSSRPRRPSSPRPARSASS